MEIRFTRSEDRGVVVLNERIYGGGDRNRRLFCLDWKTGKELFTLNQLAPANIISNDGLLYVYSGKREYLSV